MEENNKNDQPLNQNNQGNEQNEATSRENVTELQAMIDREFALQKETLNNADPNKTKTRNNLIFILSVCILLIIVVPPIFKLFNNQDSISDRTANNNQEQQRFTPISKIGDVVEIRGEIKESDYNEDNYEYLLTDGNGNIIAYLHSNNIELSLSSDMNVTVSGKVTSNYKGSIVIKVNEIKLK